MSHPRVWCICPVWVLHHQDQTGLKQWHKSNNARSDNCPTTHTHTEWLSARSRQAWPSHHKALWMLMKLGKKLNHMLIVSAAADWTMGTNWPGRLPRLLLQLPNEGLIIILQLEQLGFPLDWNVHKIVTWIKFLTPGIISQGQGWSC